MNTKYNKRIKLNIGLDYLSTFITNLNMQSSIWVLYLAYCGLNLAEVGLLEGIYHATSILCETPSGAMADLLGRKKTMIVSRVCIAVSCIIMLFSNSFWLFALSFIIQALGNNFNSGSEEALVYDSMKCLGQEEKYIGVCGKINMIIEISQALAVVAGGVLAEYSYVWCYGACVFIAVLALLPVLLMTEPFAVKKKEEEKEHIWNVVKRHFKVSVLILKEDTRILKVIVYYSVIFASYTLLFFYSQQYYSDLGYNKIQISVILLFVGIMSCLGALGSEKLYEFFGKKIGAIAAGCIAFAYIGYGFESPALAIGAFMLAGFFNSVLYPVQSDALNSLIPSEQRATLISVNSMCFSIAMIISFPIAGVMADYFGLGQVLGALGIALAAFLFIWNLVEIKK